MKQRALLSVTDKSGLVEFAKGLAGLGFELLSTGGTAQALATAGLRVTPVSDVTGFPEIMNGRVKTLHPKIHGGLLGDTQNPEHTAQMAEHGIEPIQVVAVNLYAFRETVGGEHQFEDAVESIDIGGPAMIRAAAKNSANVLIIVDPDDYPRVLAALAEGAVQDLRRELMAKAFAHTAAYDCAIASYLADAELPQTLTLCYERASTLRYGENPHQPAVLYRSQGATFGVASATKRWGKELSYNNLLDGDAAWELVCDLPVPACAIIKHSNPCGASHAANAAVSYSEARAGDPISAFGGIAAFNAPIDLAAAQAMTEKGNFLEVVIAPAFSPEAIEVFKNKTGWGQEVRLLECPLSPTESEWQIRSIRGGVLVQQSDEDPELDWECVTVRKPTSEEAAALRFAFRVVQHVKSNGIVVCAGTRLLGTGAGQMNRVQSVRLALEQAGVGAKGAVLASDAFFPFPDSIETAARAGITAVVQPGGSKKDSESIDAANRLGIAMVITGIRHFKH